MPTGRHPRAPRASRGITYLTLLFVLAGMAATAAAVGETLVRQQQRERERELAFRGQQIRAALLGYRSATPAGQPPLPSQLEQLVADTRHTPPVHHLRRLYDDPFTGQADWLLLRRADGLITGVHSRSSRPPLTAALPAGATAPGRGDGAVRSVGDWHFAVDPAVMARVDTDAIGRER